MTTAVFRELAATLGVRLGTPRELEERTHGPPLARASFYNTRTGKPDRWGLLCCRAFGPIQDDACLCGKYRGAKHRGITCEKCGVLVTSSDARRERFGRIALAEPVLHPWFARDACAALSVTEEELARGWPLEDRAGDALGAWLKARGAPVLEVLPVLPAGLRPITFRARDPEETARVRAAKWTTVHGEIQLEEEVVKIMTHDVIPGALNERYAKVIRQNERVAAFRARAAPAIVMLREEAELLRAVTKLLAAVGARATSERDLLAAGFVPDQNL